MITEAYLKRTFKTDTIMEISSNNNRNNNVETTTSMNIDNDGNNINNNSNEKTAGGRRKNSLVKIVPIDMPNIAINRPTNSSSSTNNNNDNGDTFGWENFPLLFRNIESTN